MSERNTVQFYQGPCHQVSADTTTTSSGSFDALSEPVICSQARRQVTIHHPPPIEHASEDLRAKRRRLLLSHGRHAAWPVTTETTALLGAPNTTCAPSTSSSASSRSSTPPFQHLCKAAESGLYSSAQAMNERQNAVVAYRGPGKNLTPSPLMRRASTVSVSNVGNVFTRRSLTTFSSFKQSSLAIDDGEAECTATAYDPGEKAPLRKGVKFGEVYIYYFQRAQGFDTVPSSGAISLGMEYDHFSSERCPIAMQENDLEASFGLPAQLGAGHGDKGVSEDDEDSPDCSSHSRAHPPDSTNIKSIGGKTRMAMLKGAEVRIDKTVRIEYSATVAARQECGCKCDGDCTAENSCYCVVAGVNCQVERPMFPCSCTAGRCKNPAGRTQFEESRIRSHFIATMQRLKGARIEGSTSKPDWTHSAEASSVRGAQRGNSVTTQYPSEVPQISIPTNSTGEARGADENCLPPKI